MADIKGTEKKWVELFNRCSLIHQGTGTFQHAYAHQLFYGRQDASYPSEFPDHFLDFFEASKTLEPEITVDHLIPFLHFIGIKIKKTAITQHLSKYPQDLPKLLKKAYYIFKSLAHQTEKFQRDNPFADCRNEIYFLARVETGESIRGGQLDLFEDLDLPDLYNKYIQIPDNYDHDQTVKDLFHQIESGNESFFITGKAGTGKSTFIHYFVRKTNKKVLMTAFTGIAAINIGGETIHSFFKFPLQPFLPEDEEIPLFKPYFHQYKIIEKTDTIVIDEISMLRADVLEAIDYSLRKNGGHPDKVFGGKQVLFVGDLFQLPPVTNLSDEVEKYIFREVFKSAYFFDAHAYRRLNPRFVEFKKVHRQKDDLAFIDLLDQVRTCNAGEATLAKLNQRHNPEYTPKPEDFVITLTANNTTAHKENTKKLTALSSPSYFFEATIIGEFRDDKFPTNRTLELKKNAQVIFIKNDTERKWVNGTIVKIDFLSENRLEVRLKDGTIHKLEKETWENRRFKYDREKRKIVSEVIGTFTQYPVKLAWAITIHKSQGLTFDHVIIDLGAGAFVNGQVYTALSRCRTLEGITLRRKLESKDIIADQRVIRFHETEQLLNGLDLSSE